MNESQDEHEAPTVTETVQLLFVRHENSIRAFVRSLQPSLSDADDVMQETFLTWHARIVAWSGDLLLWRTPKVVADTGGQRSPPRAV